MVGFDKERVFGDLDVPNGYKVEAVYAVGKLDDPSSLPEMLKAREHPSARKPVSDLAFEGSFRK